MFKKSVSVLFAIIMALGIVSIVPVSAQETEITQEGAEVEVAQTGKSVDEAIAWVQSQVGHSIDMDGYPSWQPYQCVDLIKAYYQFLGVSPVSGDGFDYTWNDLPSGWNRYQGVQPQRGDILIYHKSEGNGYAGHVAIYESDRVTYHQNFDGCNYVVRATYKYNEINDAYWGVVRPSFSDTTPQGHEMSESEAAGRTIPDGDYWICSRIAHNYFLDIPGTDYNTKNETNLQMWIIDSAPFLSSVYDVFHIKYLNNGFYEITQHNTKKAIDVYSASMACGTNLQMYDSNNTKAQQWSIEQTGSGYRIRSRCNAFCMDVAAATYGNGTNVRVWEDNGTDSQRFGFIPYAPDERPLADGIYTIVSALSDTCFLDVSGVPGDFKSDSNVQVYNNSDNWGHPDEKFRFEYAGNGYYRIYEYTSGLALEIYHPGSSMYLSAEKNAKLYPKNNSRGQFWKIRKNTDGTYSFINQLSGYCLDVRSGSSENGTNVQDFPDNGTKAQKWKPLRVLQNDMVIVEDLVLSDRGTMVAPSTTVKADDIVLNADTDYTVTTFVDIANLKGTVTVKGANDYCNTITKEFTITLVELLGDADGDGEVTSIDVTYVKRNCAFMNVDITPDILMNADIDGNGLLEITDVTYIQRYLAFMDTKYPIGETI